MRTREQDRGVARGLRAHFAPALAGRVTRLGEPIATAYMPSDMALQLARLPYESLAVGEGMTA